MNESYLLNYLKTNYSQQITAVEYLNKGMFSSAYLLTEGDSKKILRLSNSNIDFLKDKLASQFTSDNLPIPKILSMGQLNEDSFYVISNCCPGQIFNSLSLKQQKMLLPAIFNTLLAIFKTDISRYSNYGPVNIQFDGTFDSWGSYILSIDNPKITYNWNEILNKPFFDQDSYNYYKNLIVFLTPSLPTTRYLVHGDFGFDNLLVQESEVTGVIDWGEAKLGDFLYDVAWLDFWSKDINFSRQFKPLFQSAGLDTTHYEQRIQCYLSKIALDSLAIAAHFNDRVDYNNVLSKLQAHVPMVN